MANVAKKYADKKKEAIQKSKNKPKSRIVYKKEEESDWSIILLHMVKLINRNVELLLFASNNYFFTK